MKKTIGVICFFSVLYSSSTRIVRCYVSSWDELLSYIASYYSKELPEVAGAHPGEYYDLICETKDIDIMRLSGMNIEIVVQDFYEWRKMFLGQYHSYEEVKAILRDYAVDFPDICKVESIGPSYEGRWIYGLKISDNPYIEENEVTHVFSGCTHSREWATVEVCLFLIDSLLVSYSTVFEIQNLIDNREIYIFPILNPDGYVYDYSNNGVYWRKNRQPFHGYIGTDLNRNYNGSCGPEANAGWGWIPPGGSVSHHPNSTTFCGFKNNSSPEITEYIDFLKLNSPVTVVDYHSYGEVILVPWGYLSGPTPHDEWITGIAEKMGQRIQRLEGGYYTWQYSLYPVSGNARDWHYSWNNFVNGTPCISYVIEVGTSFYQPESDLDFISRENFKGALYLIQKGDSIYQNMKGFVPSPYVHSIDTVGYEFYLSWTPRNKNSNQPVYFEIVRFRTPSPFLEDFESFNSDLWIMENFSLSTQRAHSGNYSIYSGAQNNISAQIRTKYPYFVKQGDSLVFWTYYDLETEYDVAIVEVSFDTREWYPLVDERFNGFSGGWVKKVYPLENWANSSIYIRWRVMTDAYALEEGFYIDDVYPVPNWGEIDTVSSQVYDTFYSFSGLQEDIHYFAVRGYSSQFGWGNWSVLEDAVVNYTYISERMDKGIENIMFFTGKNKGFLYKFNSPEDIAVVIYDRTGRKRTSLMFFKLSGTGRLTLKGELPQDLYFIKLYLMKGKKNLLYKGLFLK